MNRFKGLVDEETLKLLSLYSAGRVRIKAEVRSLRLFGNVLTLRMDGAGVSFKSYVELSSFPELSKAGVNSVLLLEGKFAGDLFKVENLSIITPSTFEFKGVIAALSENVFVISNCFDCMSVYCVNVNSKRNCKNDCGYNFKNNFNLKENISVTLKGAKSDNEVLILDSLDLSKESFEIKFLPLDKVKNKIKNRVCIRGRVSGIGEKKKWFSLYLSDESGRVKLLMCDKFAEFYRKADIGDYVEVFGCLVGEKAVFCDEFTILKANF